MIFIAYRFHMGMFFLKRELEIGRSENSVLAFKDFLKRPINRDRLVMVEFGGLVSLQDRKIILPELFLHQTKFILDINKTVSLFDADLSEGDWVGKDNPDSQIFSSELQNFFAGAKEFCTPKDLAEIESFGNIDYLEDIIDHLLKKKKPFRVTGLAMDMFHVYISERLIPEDKEDVILPEWLENHLL